MGRTLLAARSYMEQPYAERNREKLLFTWKYAIAVMRNEALPSTVSNDWELLIAAAEAVGVHVNLEGTLPESGSGSSQ